MTETSQQKGADKKPAKACDCEPRVIAANALVGTIRSTFDCNACRARVGIPAHVPRFLPYIPGC